MNVTLFVPHFSRPVGTPPFGKRTARLKFALAPLTKDLCEEEAHRLGMTTSEFVHQVVLNRVHGFTHVREITVERLKRVAGNEVKKGGN